MLPAPSRRRPSLRVLAGSLAFVLVGSLVPRTALTAAPGRVTSIAPWQSLSAGLYGSTRFGAFVPIADPEPGAGAGRFTTADGAALFVGTDLAGLGRAVELAGSGVAIGARWEPANGGRGFSDSLCGGYDPSFYRLGPAARCYAPGAGADTAPTPLRQAQVYGGPPAVASLPGRHRVGLGVASGPWPAALQQARAAVDALAIAPDGSARSAGSVLYRASQDLYVSPDAGRQWFPLAAGCSHNRWTAIEAVAADAGAPGRVVVGGWRVSGCDGARDADGARQRECGQRYIGYSDDVGAQVIAAITATASPEASVNGAVSADLASRFRYASLAHLAVDRFDPQSGRLQRCVLRYGEGGDDGLVGPGCVADAARTCHGRRPKSRYQADFSAFCPNQAAPACRCRDQPSCRYPYPWSLVIDPRSGFVYASAIDAEGKGQRDRMPLSVGLLTSTDGGASWLRLGRGKRAQVNVRQACGAAGVCPAAWLPAGAPTTAALVDPRAPPGAPAGARLLTMQGLESVPGWPGASLPAADPAFATDALALDLNAHPALLVDVGRVSLGFSPCANGASGVDGRPRGDLVAAVNVTFRRADAPSAERSGVFVAVERDRCEGPAPPRQPLVFRDTANLMPTAGAGPLYADGAPVRWVKDADLAAFDDGALVKLPLDQVRDNESLVGRVDAQRMRYVAAAVAPSDSRVIYAFGYAVAHRAGRWRHAELSPYQHGLYRSVDRGRSWQLVHSVWQGGMRGVRSLASFAGVDLSVAPHNPYRVFVAPSHHHQIASGSRDAFLFEPVGAGALIPATAWPEAPCARPAGQGGGRCPGCEPSPLRLTPKGSAGPWGCRFVGRQLRTQATNLCDPERVPADLCARYRAVIGARRAGRCAARGAADVCLACRRAADGAVRCEAGERAAGAGDDSVARLPPQCAHLPVWRRADLTSDAATAAPARPLSAACVPCADALGPRALAPAAAEVWGSGAARACCERPRHASMRPAEGSARCRPVDALDPDERQQMVRADRLSLPGHSGGSALATQLVLAGDAGADSSSAGASGGTQLVMLVGHEDPPNDLARPAQGALRSVDAVSATTSDSLRVACTLPGARAPVPGRTCTFAAAGAPPSAPPVALTPYGGVDAQVAYATPARPDPLGRVDALWALGNDPGGGPDGFLRLVRLFGLAPGAAPAIHVLPSVFDPRAAVDERGRRTLYGAGEALTAGRALPEHGLIKGPALPTLVDLGDAVVVAAAGAGVAWVPIATSPSGLTAAGALVGPEAVGAGWPRQAATAIEAAFLLGPAGPARAIAFRRDDGAVVRTGACVSDLVAAPGSDGAAVDLFATVAMAADVFADRRCAMLRPGLYRAGLRRGDDGSLRVGDAEFVAVRRAGVALGGDDGDPLGDPRALAVYASDDGDGLAIHILVADWAVDRRAHRAGPGEVARAFLGRDDRCGGGLWRYTPSRPAGARWRLLTRMNQISDVVVDRGLHAAAGRDVQATFSVFASHRGIEAVGDRSAALAPSPDRHLAADAAAAAPLLPGVYALRLSGLDGGSAAWIAHAPDGQPRPWCDAGHGGAEAASAACLPDRPGVRGVCRALAAAPAGHAGIGLAAAGAGLLGLSAGDDAGLGVTVGSLGGNGAFWLPPAHSRVGPNAAGAAGAAAAKLRWSTGAGAGPPPPAWTSFVVHGARRPTGDDRWRPAATPSAAADDAARTLLVDALPSIEVPARRRGAALHLDVPSATAAGAGPGAAAVRLRVALRCHDARAPATLALDGVPVATVPPCVGRSALRVVHADIAPRFAGPAALAVVRPPDAPVDDDAARAAAPWRFAAPKSDADVPVGLAYGVALPAVSTALSTHPARPTPTRADRPRCRRDVSLWAPLPAAMATRAWLVIEAADAADAAALVGADLVAGLQGDDAGALSAPAAPAADEAGDGGSRWALPVALRRNLGGGPLGARVQAACSARGALGRLRVRLLVAPVPAR